MEKQDTVALRAVLFAAKRKSEMFQVWGGWSHSHF